MGIVGGPPELPARPSSGLARAVRPKRSRSTVPSGRVTLESQELPISIGSVSIEKVYMYIHTYIHTRVYIYTHIINIYVYIHIYAYVSVCISTYSCVCMYLYICLC